MSKIDDIKARVRKNAAHDQLMDPVVPNGENSNVDVDVNVNVIRRPKRVKFEELYTRGTFYIENNLLAELNKRAGDEKGEKTRIVNEALEQYFKNNQ